MIAGDRDRAGVNRGFDEARAIRLEACQRKKQVAGPDDAAIHRKAFDRNRFGRGVDPGLIAEEVAKSHDLKNLMIFQSGRQPPRGLKIGGRWP
jgi:hypothetical protein